MNTNNRPRPNKGNKKGTTRQVWRDVNRKDGTRFRQRFYVKDQLQYDTERDKTTSLGEKVRELANLEKLHGFYQPGREKTLKRDSDGKQFTLTEHINPDGTIGGWVSSEANVIDTYVSPNSMVLSGNLTNSVVDKETVVEISGDVINAYVSDSTLTGKTFIIDSHATNTTIHDSYVSQNSKIFQSDVNDSIMIETTCDDAYLDGGRINKSALVSSDVVKGSTVYGSSLSTTLAFASVVENAEVTETKMFGSFIQPGTRISMSNLRGADVSSDPTTKATSTLTGVSAAESVQIIGSEVELSNLNNVTIRRSKISNCSLANGSIQETEFEDVNEVGKKDLPYVIVKQTNLA